MRERCAAVALALVLVSGQARALPVFPGAEGFGSDTVAGRGGRAIFVTTLDDAGPGSLRQALELETGPRTVIFRVGGSIALASEIRIREQGSYVTVAGQSAPGDGIQLVNYGLVVRDGGHDVLVRHLRIRAGDTTPGIWDKDGVLVWGNAGSEVHHIVFDHVSIQWATDENVNVYEHAHDVTFQSCIIAEGSNTGHPSGPHSKGMLVAADPRITLSIHRTLFAHNGDRNPKLMDNAQGVYDVRHNVVYDWGNNNAARLDTGARVNLVGNTFVAGPSSSTGNLRVLYVPDALNASGIALHLADNIAPLCPSGCADPWDIGVWYDDGAIHDADPAAYTAAPLPAPTITGLPPVEVLPEVLAQAGATRPLRDAVDARIVDEVASQSGSVGVGSDYPVLQGGAPAPDGDDDGMPDAWEAANGLDPADPSDQNGDLDGDGYTNLEAFLDELAQNPSGGGDAGGGPGDGGSDGAGASGSGGAGSAARGGDDSGCAIAPHPIRGALGWAWLGAALMALVRRKKR